MVTLASATAQAMNDAHVDLLDAGTTPTLNLYSSGDVLLVSFDLDATAAFGASTNACPSVATATGLPIDTNAESFGATPLVVDYAVLKDGNGATVTTVTSADIGVIGSGSPIEITSLTITQTQPMRLQSLTISQPCS